MFENAPMLVFWETTQACELACRHCRAEAAPEPARDELTTSEGERLIEQLASFGPRPPVLVLTGGDVMMRPDLFELISFARGLSFPVALAPSVTPRLTAEALERMRDLGVTSVSISLDGASGATHDPIRGVKGHFECTIATLSQMRALGITTQVNTAVMQANVEDLAGVASLVRDVGASSWEVFFLVQVGRGIRTNELSAEQNEDVAHVLFDASRYDFIVRTVEAPWFRRVVSSREEANLVDENCPYEVVAQKFALGPLYRRLSRQLVDLLGPPTSAPRVGSAGTRDGKGIFFIARDGWALPAGFLPVRLGNIREQHPVDLYRDHPLLRAIRSGSFSGRCGRCEFREYCGGSRARAFAATGDALGEDPGCVYIPAA